MPITEQIQAYVAAKRETAHLELAKEELEQTFKRWLEAKLPATIREEYEAFQESIAQIEAQAKLARKAESEAKEILRVVAHTEAAADENLRGRVLHPHIDIQNTSEVVFADVGKAALWLCQQGREEDVKLKVSSLNWYRAYQTSNSLPDFISIHNIPLVKIDTVWEV